ncbi:hypothetical protein GCM10007916_06870 [Psychromonas marina]|uniref:NAD-dependent epimerase/dehydratase domain-containing protein n=1 Tax=Psychromonas marina TaxID=88364 RepID=A0ABQ6DWX4_9GAMM|nr:hypothetical protein [Psychromonas marina]GLS89620.1 hypothetical protein GCM10007916_06870 [Psychromonas marina]
MIVGNGLLASYFNKYSNNDNYLVFASGVSNSNELNTKCFFREETLLRETINSESDKHFIYFSSCDVIYCEQMKKPYYFHKKRMEKIIADNCRNFTIFRLPQIISKSNNPHLLVNYFKDSILNKKQFNIWCNATKNLVHIDDVFLMVDYAINNMEVSSKTINIVNSEYYSVDEIVNTISDFLGLNYKAHYMDKGVQVCYKCLFSSEIIYKSGVDFGADYIKKALEKSWLNE